MQSESYEALYGYLENITLRTRFALGQDDFKELMSLLQEQRDVMGKLDRAGLSQDTNLLKPIEELRNLVRAVVEEIAKRRKELGRQLIMFEKKKKVSAAYAGAILPIMAII